MWLASRLQVDQNTVLDVPELSTSAMLVYKFLRVCRLHLATSIANDCELASDVDTLSVRLLSLRIPEYTRKSLLSVLFIFSASGN